MLPIFGVKKWERDENNVVMLPHFCHAPNFFLLLPKFRGEKTSKFGSMIKNMGA